MTLRMRIAELLAGEELEKQRVSLQQQVNQRVADALFKMDPFEPLMRKYNVIFSDEWIHPEDKLDERSRMGLFMWAYGARKDPHFTYMMDWIRNTQGNNTLRKGKNSDEWLYGRACIATITLFIEEVGRLASKYEEIVANRDDSFDKNLTVEA